MTKQSNLKVTDVQLHIFETNRNSRRKIEMKESIIATLIKAKQKEFETDPKLLVWGPDIDNLTQMSTEQILKSDLFDAEYDAAYWRLMYAAAIKLKRALVFDEFSRAQMCAIYRKDIQNADLEEFQVDYIISGK